MGGESSSQRCWANIPRGVCHRNKLTNFPKDGQIKTLEKNNSIMKGKALALGSVLARVERYSTRPHCSVPWTNHNVIGLEGHDT